MTNITLRSNGVFVFVKNNEKTNGKSFDGRTKVAKFHAKNEARQNGKWKEMTITNEEAKKLDLI